MGFEPPIEETQHEVALPATLLWEDKKNKRERQQKTVNKSQDEGECNSDNALWEGP